MAASTSFPWGGGTDFGFALCWGEDGCCIDGSGILTCSAPSGALYEAGKTGSRDAGNSFQFYALGWSDSCDCGWEHGVLVSSIPSTSFPWAQHDVGRFSNRIVLFFMLGGCYYTCEYIWCLQNLRFSQLYQTLPQVPWTIIDPDILYWELYSPNKL